MKTSMKIIIITAVALFTVGMTAFTIVDDWVVPEKYMKMKNPVSADNESINIGKVLYAKHCKSCHGKYGEGDGPKAEELDTSTGDFTTAEFQKQPDGSIFYKTIAGRDEMPEFRKKIPADEDVWHIVNYIRTLD